MYHIYIADILEIEERVHNILATLPLGSLLKHAQEISQGNETEIVNCYLSDFVNMMYSPVTNQPEIEYQVCYWTSMGDCVK